ncbi:inter-alpha-trypsin inhibitor-like [Montipora foliosa]|uniref:inter-alpha-trypsin inhibitor-like n=1 Tax=Montipora foliosa TaxID=591990 RepID=UPI0035F13851
MAVGRSWCFVCLFSFLIICIVKSEEEKEEFQGELEGKNCSAKVQPGPCMGYFPRWFFNTTSKKCHKFIYGGCRGNGNNFESKDECKAECILVKEEDDDEIPEGPCTKVKKLLNALLVHGVPMQYTPDCDDEGFYKPKQCKHHLKKCWCVDRRGNKVKNNGRKRIRRGHSDLQCS